MKSIPFFAGLGLTAFLSSCSVYHSAPIDLNAEEASWKEASRVDTHISVTRNQARQIGLVMNPDLNKARLKLASSNEAAKQHRAGGTIRPFPGILNKSSRKIRSTCPAAWASPFP